MKKRLLSFLIVLSVLVCCFSGCTDTTDYKDTDLTSSVTESVTGTSEIQGDSVAKLSGIPEFTDEPYCVLNNNIPELTSADAHKTYFEEYSALDSFGRCTLAYACLGPETLPAEERGEIGSVKPSGWVTAKYDFVDGRYLYNRCHLIGFQLSGENANERNLITGTRYMNVQGMLPFENMVADYIKDTGNHVLYRVTPIFKDYELVARGVQMEAYSVEDEGDGICFNVYCYNNQPGVSINYATGESGIAPATQSAENNEAEKTATYILNTSSKKIHLPSCSSVGNMNPDNKEEYKGTKEDLLKQGYKTCGSCKP